MVTLGELEVSQKFCLYTYMNLHLGFTSHQQYTSLIGVIPIVLPVTISFVGWKQALFISTLLLGF